MFVTDNFTCSDENHIEIPSSVTPPLIHPENNEVYTQVVNSFREAEKRLKVIEWQDGELDIPAINELRYVGNHIFNALYCNGISEQYEQLKRAERHCKRANYDAIELGLIDLMEKFRCFHEEYRDIAVADIVPGYIQMMTEVRATRTLLSVAPGDSRDDYYNDAWEKLLRLKDIWELLEASHDELSKRRNRLQQAELHAEAEKIRADTAEAMARKTLLASVCAILVAIILGAPSLYGMYKETMLDTESAFLIESTNKSSATQVVNQ